MTSGNKTKLSLLDVDTLSILESVPGCIYWKNLDSVYMGCNRDFLNIVLADNVEDVVGKTDYTLPWGGNREVAAKFIRDDQYVISTGNTIVVEDNLDMKNSQGVTVIVRTEKRPLRDKKGNIVGVLGIAIDISDQKEAETLEMDTHLMLDLAPGYIYWKDLNSIYLGFNQNFKNLISQGFDQNFKNSISSKKLVGAIGLSEYEMPWASIKPETAAHNMEADQHVISTGKIIVTEEDIGIKKDNGLSTILRSEKRPLRNKKGSIIGVLGVSVDITDQKEAERLRLESERQQITLQEKEKFTQLARKVAHDINSPLAALKMMIPLCTEIPENKRMLLIRATEGILDIANNLLSNYQKQKDPTTSEVEPRQPLLVSDLLIQLLSEKKMQYRNRPITIDTVIANDAQFAFIKMQTTEFRRSISNLINNAVDALENNTHGQVTIQLTADDNTVVVEIRDDGKGLTSEMIEKIQNRQRFTEGKKNGNGLGLQQAWDTLEYNEGAMEVQSTLGKGTSIQLTFPRITAAKWIAQEIHLNPDNIIVILDDDESIHTAWNLRFSPLLTSYSDLQLHHFTQGQDALNFFAALNEEETSRVIFLSDFELLHQERNGLQIVEASGIQRAMLVTSYYANPKIREATDRLGIKVLPKQMASIIPIYIDSDHS
jgi:PAS domain S-box-containing protein